MRCQRCEESFEGHCCECGDPIPTEEQRFTNGHLFCEFCRHPKFREPSIEISVSEEEPQDSDKTLDFLPEDWREVVPPTFENHDPPAVHFASVEDARQLKGRPRCTCDGAMQLPDPHWPGCCERCGGVIDTAEVMLYNSRARRSELENGIAPEKHNRGLVRRLLDSLRAS